MNKIATLLTLIIFCSCGARTFDGRFERLVETEAEMHFGPSSPPPSALPIEEKSILLYPSKEVQEEKEPSPAGWWNA